MNILLINPNNNSCEKMYPITLGIISALLKNSGHNVFGFDQSFQSKKRCLDFILKKNIAFIGIDISLQNYPHALSLAKDIQFSFNIPIIFFGSYINAFYQDIMKNNDLLFRYMIIDDKEITFCNLLECLIAKTDLKSLEGIVYVDGDRHTITRKKGSLIDFDLLPFPDRELFPIKQYKGMISKHRDYTQIVATKGCPHRCLYCHEYKGEPIVRTRTPKNIVDEIERIINQYHITDIHLEDANLISGNIPRIKKICDEILKRKVFFDWQCAGVIPINELKDFSLFPLMARAGCYNISLGIESFDPRTTNKMNRHQEQINIDQIIKQCKDAKIEVSCHLIIGFPGQTYEDIKTDIKKSREYPFDFIHYNIFYSPENHYEDTRERLSKRTIQEKCLNFHDLLKIQKTAYMKLIFKRSIIQFILKRVLRNWNMLNILIKLKCYFLREQSLHL